MRTMDFKDAYQAYLDGLEEGIKPMTEQEFAADTADTRVYSGLAELEALGII